MAVFHGANTADPVIVALQAFITSLKEPRNSSPRKPLSKDSVLHQHLALQLVHDLRFQHDWTELNIHYTVPGSRGKVLPRPIVSGASPQRIYINPDKQIEILQKQEGTAGWSDLECKCKRNREWVLPSHQRESWGAERFAAVFDLLPEIPPDHMQDPSSWQAPWTQRRPSVQLDPLLLAGCSSSDASNATIDQIPHRWRKRQPKRLLLAKLGKDSTVVYQIVHNGPTTPRQNGANSLMSARSR